MCCSGRLSEVERAMTGCSATLKPAEPLARHTTFRIGGPAGLWVEVGDEPALAALLDCCQKQAIPTRVLGFGSNVLISDQGLAGVVFRLAGEFAGLKVEESRVEVGAGVWLDDIAEAAESAGLDGFEFLAGIPGTLGGGLRTNAGAFGRSLADLLESLRVMDPDGSTRTLGRDEIGNEYRKPVYPGNAVAVGATLKGGLPVPADRDCGRPGHEPGCSDNGARTVAEIRCRRREKQPTGHSAGSFFKNPPGEAAGRLIERCGLKGRRVGAARVSEIHANFIMNTGGARFADVYGLAQVVKANVEAQTGILLEEEVEILPDGFAEGVNGER